MAEYQYSDDEFVDLMTNITLRYALLLVPFVMVIALFFVATRRWVNLVALVMAIPVVAALIIPIVKWVYHRMFAHYDAIREPVHLLADDDAMTFRSATTTYVMVWSRVKKWREDHHHFLLYEADLIFRPIPKRALSEAELDLIREKLKSTKTARI